MRYRMILIDDEAVILRGLRKLIDWDTLNIDIVGEAWDGEKGLELIRSMKPDIVISDIAMPNLNGIEMLREIYRNNWNIKTVFLSGYQEFSYAQEAVRYGAVDYLLKPIGAKQLEQVLTGIIARIQRERSVHVLQKTDSRAEVAFQEVLQKKNNELTVDQMVRLLKTNADRADRAHGALGAAIETAIGAHTGAVCAVLQIGMRNTVKAEENKSLIRYEIYQYVQDSLQKEGAGGVIRKEQNACCILLYGADDRKYFRRVLSELSKKISGNYPVLVRIGIGAWADSGGKMSYLYSTAKFASELYYFEEELYIDFADIRREYEHSLEEYEEQLGHVKRQLVNHCDLGEVIPQILECVRILGMIHYGSKNAVINSCILLAGEIRSVLVECGLWEKDDTKDQEGFLGEIRQKTSFRLLVKAFEDFYGRTLLKIQLLNRNRESVEIVKIKQYMQQRFRENLTLEELADYIGMNASYMSTFFKRETGKNFKVYLTELRMQEALRLLNSTNMKSYEVADAVGYRDVKQFREKFKEVYGVSPQQYKKRGHAQTD